MDLLLLGNEECFLLLDEIALQWSGFTAGRKISQITIALHVSGTAVPPGPLQARRTRRDHLPFTSSEGASPYRSFFTV